MKCEWKRTTILECSTILGDGLHGTPKYCKKGEYAFINGNNLQNGYVVIKSDTKRVNVEEYEKYKKDLNERTILVSINGTIGNTARYRGEKVVLGKSACYFNAKDDVSADFFYYVVNTPDFQNYLIQNATGTTIKNVSLKQMREYPFLLPDIETQNQIASILKSLDDKIAVNQLINDNLLQQAQALYKSWFVDLEPFGGETPNDWQRLNFSDFLSPQNEKTDDPNIPMYSVTDTGIYPRDEKFKKSLSMAGTKSKIIRRTNLVFGMSREILNWGIMRDQMGGVSSAYNVFSVAEEINTYYLESYIKSRSSYFKDLIKPASREGQGIDKNALMSKVLILPPRAVLDEYYSLEHALTKVITQYSEENVRLSDLRDALLPKLMSGEIDVSDVQI